jgi:hypothetical protein
LALPNQTIRKANRDLNGSTKGAKATEDGEAHRASNPSVSATCETSAEVFCYNPLLNWLSIYFGSE